MSQEMYYVPLIKECLFHNINKRFIKGTFPDNSAHVIRK